MCQWVPGLSRNRAHSKPRLLSKLWSNLELMLPILVPGRPQVGRAFFEMVDYPEAARCFQAARQADPYRLKVGPAFRTGCP